MRQDDVIDHVEHVCSLAVYDTPTSTEPDHDKRQATVNDFIQQQPNDLNCLQVSSRVGLPGPAYNFDTNEVFTLIKCIDGAVQKSFLRHYYHVFYFIGIIWDSKDIQVRDISSTESKVVLLPAWGERRV